MVTLILIGVFIAIFVGLVLVIQFPSLIDVVYTYVDAIIYYVGQGLDFVWLFVPKSLTVPLMSLAIGVEVIVLGYKFVMWIVRKIPTASIN